ncbi:hypothetical protein J2W71_003409 [Pseudomonas sp. 3400]|nr:hypothetical protein [Pseudomonas sp. 3400]MDR7013469.1 hypothetical protein [Pseudomonas alcaliphila]
MRGKRIDVGALPLTDPQAEAWIRQGAVIDNGNVERYSTRLTLDVTPALHTHLKLAPFARGVTMAEMLRELLKQQALSLRIGTNQTWRPLTLLADSVIALGWATLATSPPRLIYNTPDNVPTGRYRTSPANSLAPGDLMLVHLLP